MVVCIAEKVCVLLSVLIHLPAPAKQSWHLICLVLIWTLMSQIDQFHPVRPSVWRMQLI